MARSLMPTGAIFVSRLALPEEQSVAAALFQTLLQLGGSFGLTLTSVIATAYQNKALARGVEEVDALLEGLHASFWLSAACAFTALALAAATLHGIGIVSQVGQDGKAPSKDKTVDAENGSVVDEEGEAVEVAGGKDKEKA